MEFGVLGPTRVLRGDEQVDLGTRKQRALLAALALHAGRPVSVDKIIDLIWGDDPPPGVTATLQAYVAGLRRALEPSRERRAPAALLVTIAPGYALRLQPDELDVARFARLITHQHQRLAPVGALIPNRRCRITREDLQEVVQQLDQALGLWRGEAYGELADAPDARAERVRLGELQLLGIEDRALASTWLGHAATVVAELDPVTAAHPMRERLWGIRALALARSGRQGDALEVLRVVREVLDDELGLEPGPDLRALQTAVLRQDPALEWLPSDSPERREPRRPASDTVDRVVRPVEPDAAPARAARPDQMSGPGWPMVGRDAQLTRLLKVLDQAATAGPTFAGLVGEPGIGKTRLASELIVQARSRQIAVLVGRCSQDDGAPPLWPWASVLDGLGHLLPAAGPDDREISQFEAWGRIVGHVVDAAQQQSVLLVLDDLHWADVASLRVLRLLAETHHKCRLMVLATWREHPEPTGALADVIEMLARRHAVRLQLEGLTVGQAAEVLESVAGSRPSSNEAAAFRDRTDGNPFFLVEYARLAGERGDLTGLLAEDDQPSAVRDVLTRRLGRIPEDTRRVLRVAAVIGRQFDLPTLAGATALEEEEVLDLLEPAERAGLVREHGIDQFTFAHALVRDTAYTDVSASRRARTHAQVAEVLADEVGRESELALHWLAAGPSRADRAWRAAIAAAAQARRVHAHEQSAELLNAALKAMADDPRAMAIDRYEVLMQLIDAYRWTARWPDLVRSVETAISVAEEVGDVELVSQAAISTTIGTLWQSAPDGQVHQGIVSALRRCLERLPPSDGPTRCRVMVSLANELYYGATFAERLALVEEGLAMAERLGDERLLLDACQIAFAALWCPGTAEARLGYASRAVELSSRLGEQQAFVVSATLRTVVQAELGQVQQMWSSADTARAQAERLRIPYGLLVLDSLLIPWRSMAGQFDECDALVEEITELDGQMALDNPGGPSAEALIPLRLWQGRGEEVADTVTAMEGGPFPVTAFVVCYLLRSGRREQAALHYAAHPIDLSGNDWFAMLNWCAAAEVGLALGDHPLAAAAYAKLAPFAGRNCSAGSADAMGPVDAFLALSAAAVGELALATRHAERALELMESWQIPLAAQWLRDQRQLYAF